MKSARSEWLFVGLFGLLASSMVHAQAPEPGEEWQVTMAMQMGGMSMPGQSSTQCVALSQQTFAPKPSGRDCTSTVVSQTGNSVTMRFSCTGKDAMEGTGTFTRSGKTMKGRMNMKTEDGDEMQMNYTGVNTGKACDAKTVQRQANAAIARSQAEADKYCTETIGKNGSAALVFGKEPLCKEPKYKPMYCASIKGEQGYLMLRDEEKSSQIAHTANLVPEIEAACKVSLPAMKQQLCSSAEQRGSWQFLAHECEAEASALAAKQCAGRSYTVVSKTPYKDFCSAYAASGMVEDAGSPSAAAPADEEKQQEEQKPEKNKLKRGLKGLKGKLGL